MIYTPSLIAHAMSGLLLFSALVVLYLNFSSIGNGNKIILLILLSIGVGIHGISHLGLEYVYGFDPLKNL